MRTASLYLGSLLLAAAGCEKTDPLFCMENPGASGCPRDDGDVGDDMGDLDMGETADAQQCFGGGMYSLCLATVPMNPIVLNPGDFNTSAGNTVCMSDPLPATWTNAGQPDACIVVGSTISMSSLNVIGPRPLVLVAATTLTISGTLDASTRRSGTPKIGPGAPAAGCGQPTDQPTDSTSGAGGGAGGSFTTKGGDGGAGDVGSTSGGTAIDALVTAPTSLRAGCSGQTGGEGDSTSNGGVGGGGGGALVLIAGERIVLSDNAIVNASGAGASKAGDSGGGGGGGSGGMIVFHAPAITTGSNVFIIANGGGGGSGGNDSGGCGCTAGSDPDPLDPLSFAPGGSGGGGSGGGGFAQGTPAQNGSPNPGGGQAGGGGGGGAGFIQTNVAFSGPLISPAPVTVQ